MADLAKYGEVKHFNGWGNFSADTAVSELLGKGWELISAKIIEAQTRIDATSSEPSYIRKGGEAHYILGMPRKSKYPAPLPPL